MLEIVHKSKTVKSCEDMKNYHIEYLLLLISSLGLLCFFIFYQPVALSDGISEYARVLSTPDPPTEIQLSTLEMKPTPSIESTEENISTSNNALLSAETERVRKIFYFSGFDKWYDKDYDAGKDWLNRINKHCPHLQNYFSWVNGMKDYFKRKWMKADVYIIDFRVHKVDLPRKYETSKDKPWVLFSHESPKVASKFGNYNYRVFIFYYFSAISIS